MFGITTFALLATPFLGPATVGAEAPKVKQLTDDRYLNGDAEWLSNGRSTLCTSAREAYAV